MAEKITPSSVLGTTCSGLLLFLIYIIILGTAVCQFVSFGYGIKFLVTDFGIFHKKGECDGSELWNIMVGSVATTVLDLLACIMCVIGTFISLTNMFVFICSVEVDREYCNNLATYYALCIVSLAASLTYTILIGNEYEHLDGCAKIMNSNLGIYSEFKYFLHLTNSWVMCLSIASIIIALITRCIILMCFPKFYDEKQDKSNTTEPSDAV